MEKTPLSLRKHIAIFGQTNVGKSTLFNALLGQDVSIVSPVSGTTTDPVIKGAEIIPYGPVSFIDTAGLGDETELGEAREKKTRDVLMRTDLVLYVRDVNSNDESTVDFGKLSVINVYTKCDIANKEQIEYIKRKDPEGVFISAYITEGLEELRKKIVEELKKQPRDDETLLGDIVSQGGVVVLVIPIDSAAPKGRLILPQVQTIRDCLDHNIRCVTTTVEQLEDTLSILKNIDLVVTDSQVFNQVGRVVPKSIPLTSFSMLLANQKGRIGQLIRGARAIEHLEDGDEILMLEACTHNTTHDDIGKKKIPELLQKKTGKKLNFTHMSGYDFPEELEKYKLVIQCGGCMINKKTIQSRLEVFEERGLPVTNYGVILAELSGILDRASEIFNGK